MQSASTRRRASSIIQRFWRGVRPRTTLRLMDSCITTGLTEEYAKSIPFERLVVFLRDPLTIKAAKAGLERIHRLCALLHRISRRAHDPSLISVRVFLGAFMTAFRPTNVFESMDELETALHEAALPLLEAFEGLCRSFKEHGFLANSEQAKAFPDLLFRYLGCFKAWKGPDEAKRTPRIKHALVALYQALGHLPESSALTKSFRTQIEGLEVKLKQIVGEAALTRFQQEFRPVRLIGPTRPIVARRMTPQQLAHELLLDPKFQLLENGSENPIFRSIRQSFEQAFWDSLVDDLKLTPQCYVRVLRVLAEVRDGISQLGGTLITEIVDVDLIKQQAGLITWEGCISLIKSIVGVIVQVQAPKRVVETSAKWNELHTAMLTAENQPRLFCNGLEFLLNRVNVMRVDAANARLRFIAPVVSFEYERDKLAARIAAGATVEKTEEWLRKAVLANTPKDNSDSSYRRVVQEAIMGLVSGVDEYPETLEFDIYRLDCLRAAFSNSTLALTMLYTAHPHILQACVRKEDAKSQLESIAKYLQSSCSLTEAKIEELLSVVPWTPNSTIAKTLFNAFQHCTNNAVHVLARQRMLAVWLGDNTPNLGVGQLLLPIINVAQLRVMENVNIGVHGERYNTIIAAAVDTREQRREAKAARTP